MKLQKLSLFILCVFGAINIQAANIQLKNIRIGEGGGYPTKEACEKSCGKNSCFKPQELHGWVCVN